MSIATVPTVTSTCRRPGSRRSHGKDGPGRSVIAGRISAQCPGKAAVPVSAGVVKAITREAEERDGERYPEGFHGGGAEGALPPEGAHAGLVHGGIRAEHRAQ